MISIMEKRKKQHRYVYIIWSTTTKNQNQNKIKRILLQTNPKKEKKIKLIKIKLTWQQAMCELLLGHIHNKWAHSHSPFANGQLQKQSQQIVYSLALSQFKFYHIELNMCCMCLFHGSNNKRHIHDFFSLLFLLRMRVRVQRNFRFGFYYIYIYDPRIGRHFNSYVSITSVDFRVLSSHFCCCYLFIDKILNVYI